MNHRGRPRTSAGQSLMGLCACVEVRVCEVRVQCSWNSRVYVVQSHLWEGSFECGGGA